MKPDSYYIREGLSVFVVEKCKQYDLYKKLELPRVWLDEIKIEINHVIDMIEKMDKNQEQT